MPKFKLALAAIAVSAGLGMSGASAMPLVRLNATEAGAAQVDQVRLVCNRWGRCWHVGGWRHAYGWHRGWHRGWHHGRRW